LHDLVPSLHDALPNCGLPGLHRRRAVVAGRSLAVAHHRAVALGHEAVLGHGPPRRRARAAPGIGELQTEERRDLLFLIEDAVARSEEHTSELQSRENL